MGAAFLGGVVLTRQHLILGEFAAGDGGAVAIFRPVLEEEALLVLSAALQLFFRGYYKK